MDPTTAAAASAATDTGFLGSLGTIGGTLSSAGSFLNGIGAIGGMFGSKGPSLKRMIKVNENEMRFQRDITRDLRSTAYGDTVNSLKAAGLNPMLAYTNGVAQGGSVSYPAIQHPNQQNASADLMRAQKVSTAAQVANLMADTAKKGAETDYTNTLRDQSVEQANALRASRLNTDADTELKKYQAWLNDMNRQYGNVVQLIKETSWSTISQADASNLKAQMDKTTYQQFGELARSLGYSTMEQAFADVKFKQVLQDLKSSQQGYKLQGYAIPAAKNEADFQTSIGQAGQLGSGAKATIDLLRALKLLFGKD